MKKTRKGFTLVELLIVVSILATLTAVMTSSLTGQTAKAKAVAIASNVEACRSAARNYYIAHWDDATTMEAATTSIAVKAYIPSFGDYNRTGGAITYKPDDEATGTGVDSRGIPKWNITVSFNNDGEAALIKTELAKIPGYGTYQGTGDASAVDKLASNTFKIYLYSGDITAGS